MKIKTSLLLGPTVILGILLFSCGKNQPGQTPPLDPNAVRTEAVSTFASSLTETLAVLPSASPTVTVLPTFTRPAITVTAETPATANPCFNLLWIKDVTIPDGTHLRAGEVFTKTWLVQNIGGCAWRAGFTFNPVGGDRMRGNIVTLQEPIQTGSKREISVQLVVPSGQNGLIQSSWRMADTEGNYFGDTLSISILVGDAATPAATNVPQ
jgi:Ig-like domain from next to BRCA1 gene